MLSKKEQTVHKTEKGFSLLELIIVVVIIAIMTTVAIFALRPNQELYKTDDQALKLIDMLQEARFRALSQRETIRIEINTVTGMVSIIDENRSTTADDDTVIRRMPMRQESDIAFQTRPSGISAMPPTPMLCPDVVFAPSLHPTSAGERVATIRFNLLGQALNAGVNDRGENAAVTGATIILWPPKEGSPTDVAAPTLVRAITILSTTGNIQLWKYDGSNFIR
jgi:prepilin-type N-terminal cleavage/methylation domain-containing protein